MFFPREEAFCRNPGCAGETFDEVELSRTGRVWSYTDARYQPPPPYIPAAEPYEPFALAAVELEAEGLVVLGQVAAGYGVDDSQYAAETKSRKNMRVGDECMKNGRRVCEPGRFDNHSFDRRNPTGIQPHRK